MRYDLVLLKKYSIYLIGSFTKRGSWRGRALGRARVAHEEHVPEAEVLRGKVTPEEARRHGGQDALEHCLAHHACSEKLGLELVLG